VVRRLRGIGHMRINVLRDHREIEDIEAIAIGTSIRDIARLRETLRTGRWRKVKGKATIRLRSGASLELRYTGEAHGIEKVKI
jgi:hypothetical protein